MKIISDFNDFYDRCQGYFDDNIKYDRHSKSEFTKNLSKEFNLIGADKSAQFKIPKFKFRGDYDLYPHFFLFCGELIPFIEYKEAYVPNEILCHRWKINFIYDKNFLLEKNILEKLMKYFSHYNKSLLKNYIKDVFDLNINKDRIIEFHRLVKSPIVHFYQDLTTDYVMEINPVLKDYNFVKYKDVFSTYQDIETFLSNEMVNQFDPSDVPEKYRFIQKGFDDKYSFRRNKSN